MNDRLQQNARPLLWLVAGGFGAGVFGLSAWRWWTFRYETFDLAFYVQALWLALRGQWHVSLLDVPLMGNHAEPIVFLALPAFALCPHPLLLVLIQTLALASLPFTAWRIAQRLGLAVGEGLPLALAIVITPATAFIGLHEFHPEAFAAPLLLLVAEARLKERRGRFWLWWLLALATKENIALLLVAWALVQGIRERTRWYVLPGLVAASWFALYGGWIGPALNGGKVDYLELYSHLGRSGGEIMRTFFTQPGRVFAALRASLGGDLLWGVLLPFLALPLLRPRWLLIAAPVLLQHLLSWRSSEWSLSFHYAAPLVPLLWLATAEALPRARRTLYAWLVFAACLLAQISIGPASELPAEIRDFSRHRWERRWKAELLAEAKADGTASVTAAQPYLSHLAQREQLHSLHHVLKGLRTLSRHRYEPPPATDYVLIDYADDSTFNAASGFYHPTMRTIDGEIVPSSEALLHEFLAKNEWQSLSVNSLTLLSNWRIGPPYAEEISSGTEPVALLDAHAQLAENGAQIEIETRWILHTPPKEFRWLKLVASSDRGAFEVMRGLIAPEAVSHLAVDDWIVRVAPDAQPGDYWLRLLVTDQPAATWNRGAPSKVWTHSLGQFRLAPSR